MKGFANENSTQFTDGRKRELVTTAFSVQKRRLKCVLDNLNPEFKSADKVGNIISRRNTLKTHPKHAYNL